MLTLVGCGKKKATHPCRADRLYRGNLFSASLDVADRLGGRVAVLSAKHGLVARERMIEPYDLRLDRQGPDFRQAWSEAVAGEVLERTAPGEAVVTLAGRPYIEGWAERVASQGRELVQPLDGLELGPRLKRLAELVDDAEALALIRELDNPQAASRVELEDALRWLVTLAPNSIDTMLTDPPYCSGGFQEAKQAGAKSMGVWSERWKNAWFASDNMNTAGLVWLMRCVAIEAHRVLRKGGFALFFCDWRQAMNLAPAMESSGLRLVNMIVWDKRTAGLGLGFRARHELILVFAKGTPRYHENRHGNVISTPRISSKKRQHPTEKPAKLLEALVETTTPEGGIVVDPFAGSGSLAPVCQRLGRIYWACEREPSYHAIASARGSEASGPLFAGIEVGS